MTILARRTSSHSFPLPAKVVVLSATPASEPSSVAHVLSSVKSLDVTVATSLGQACRLVASRRPEVVVVDSSSETGPAACSRLRAASGESTPLVLVSGSLAPGALVERIAQFVGASRAERATAAAAEQLDRARMLGRIVQWKFDAEARTFAWSEDPSARFAGLADEGTLGETLLRFVAPSDRARVEHAVLLRRAHRMEYRLCLPGGDERLVMQEAVVTVDPVSGRPTLLGTVHDVSELRAAERALDRVAYYDEITALPNRAHVSSYVRAAVLAARLRGSEIAVLSFGIVSFRRLNDTFGHLAGNIVLREIASRLRATIEQLPRDAHAGEGMVARHGGDEFLAVLCDAGQEAASTFFRLASAKLAAPIVLDGTKVVVSCSAGATLSSASTADGDGLIAQADAAMHVAKAEGRSGYRVFASDMQQKLERRLDVERRLREALACGTGLELHYQPKVEARGRRVKGVEALLRWSPDARGPISPLEVVSIAEESGLIHVLGELILRTACRQAKTWSQAGSELCVAVNVSAHQFASVDFADNVARILEETQLPPGLLELEITEGSMMGDAEVARGMLTRLKCLGVRIALDDFGTGYSSLAYLTRFPIDTLKIDRSFVVEIGLSRKGEAILGAIIALSRDLAIEVVAEGVETAAQEEFLASLGELAIQGWLHSKALPPLEVLAWIARHEMTKEV